MLKSCTSKRLRLSEQRLHPQKLLHEQWQKAYECFEPGGGGEDSLCYISSHEGMGAHIQVIEMLGLGLRYTRLERAHSPNSPIATRFGVYFLHGSCSCLRPFSENVRFGVSVFFPLGVPVVSRWCNGVPGCNGPVPVVSRWCPSDVPVVFLWCLGVAVLVRSCPVCGWCPSGILVVSRRCPGGVLVVSRCLCLRPFSENLRFGAVDVPVYFPLGVPVVSRPVVCRWSNGVPVVSRWCPIGVQRCSGGVPVSQWCPGRVLVVFQWCCGGVA